MRKTEGRRGQYSNFVIKKGMICNSGISCKTKKYVEKIWSHATFHIRLCNICHYCMSWHATFLSTNYYIAPSFLLFSSFVKKKKRQFDQFTTKKWHGLQFFKGHFSKFPQILFELSWDWLNICLGDSLCKGFAFI